MSRPRPRRINRRWLIGFALIPAVFLLVVRVGSDDRSNRPPVVVVGIDGAAWEFIDPLIERGELPNLARARREGASSRLRSIRCYVSPPAWTTMFSGCLPEKTGVYTFGRWNPDTREFAGVNAGDVRVPRVWDILSDGGGRAGVFNVPMTWPPSPLQGEVVTGMMTPLDIGAAAESRRAAGKPVRRTRVVNEPDSYSSVLRTAESDSLNSYLWALYDTFDDNVKSYDTVLLTVISEDPGRPGESAVRPYLFPVGSYSPWIEILSVRDGTVESAWCKRAIVKTAGGGYEARVSPCYFRVRENFTWPESLAEELYGEFGYYSPSVFVADELVGEFAEEAARHAIYFYERDNWDFFAYVFTQSDNIHHHTGFSREALEVYRSIDRFIGDLMERMDGRGTLMVVSDHGFTGYSYGVDLNRFLAELGLLEFDDSGAVDHDHTLVFHNVWHLYFNHSRITAEELARRGIRVPEGRDPVEYLSRYLQHTARRIESVDGRHRVSLELTPLKGTGDGEPVLIVNGTSGPYVVEFLGLAQPHPAVFYNLPDEHRWWHQREGIFLAWGEGIRRGHDAGVADIQDVAPTILYLLGLPIARSLDGRLMEGILEPRLLAKRPPHVIEAYPQDLVPDAAAATRESLNKKLRTLGYLQ
jgi:predicted AlkP superfamily phosphohydrolase/phosphomutase